MKPTIGVEGGEPARTADRDIDGAGASEVARFAFGCDLRVLPQRAVVPQRKADGVGVRLLTCAGRIEDEDVGAFLAGEVDEVAGDDGVSAYSRTPLRSAPGASRASSGRLSSMPTSSAAKAFSASRASMTSTAAATRVHQAPRRRAYRGE